MIRVALGVEYDGSPFCGWESQRNGPGVQSAVESALAFVANHPVSTVCAGRTDAGVHARGQVIHFDTRAERSERAWVFGANTRLPAAVSLLWARPVGGDFHARFTALSRSYRYVIANRSTRPALLSGRACWECRELDVGAMQDAAGYLVGEHDFSAYRAVACQARNPVRRVHRIEVRRAGDLVYFDICANAFLHHMVRNIAGVLIAVGKGRARPRWALEVLAGRDRTRGGVTAPAAGLYFMGVEYPARFGLPRVSPVEVLW